MQAKPESKSIKDLIDLHKAQMLKANPEYQRGIVWGTDQKRKLIDSVLRGYPLPKIYLHHVQTSIAGLKSEGLEVIDGQQRINALHEFAEGAFKLFDPIADEARAKFPSFIKDQPCPWAGKNFEGLSDDLKEQFLSTPISIARIETKDSNEVRDLFVRLQGGVPLTAQERRDALPGKFTDYILKLGGKPEIARYPGHDFFVRSMGLTPGGSDRGKTRQLAAQIAVLFFNRHRNGIDSFCNINSAAIDDFYYENLNFEPTAPNAERFVSILDKLAQLIQPGKHSKLRGHDAMHLVLLVDMLWDDYTRSWEDRLPVALDAFLDNVAHAKATKEDFHPSEYWSQYAQWTRVSSDRDETISRRNRFYVKKMFDSLAPLQPKDPNRSFGEVERTILYYAQHKRCHVCDSQVSWDEIEVHHVDEHTKGGETILENGAVVHKKCHPKGQAQTETFAKKFHAQRAAEKQRMTDESEQQKALANLELNIDL